MPFKDLHKIESAVVRRRAWASVKETLDASIADIPSDFVEAYQKMDAQGLARHLQSMPEAKHAAVTAEYRLVKDRQYMDALESIGMLHAPEITPETIMARYKTLAAKFDPATNPASARAQAAFKRLQGHWEILGGQDEKALATLVEQNAGLKEYAVRSGKLEQTLQDYFTQHAPSGGWRDKRFSASKAAEVAANPSFPLDHLSPEQEKALLGSLTEEFKGGSATIAVGTSKTTGLRSVYVVPAKGETIAGSEIASRLEARMATPAQEAAAVVSRVENATVKAAGHGAGWGAKFALMTAAAVAGTMLVLSYFRKKPEAPSIQSASPMAGMRVNPHANQYNTNGYGVNANGQSWAAQVDESRVPGERQL